MPYCRQCREAHDSADSLYRAGLSQWRSERFSAGLRCLHQVLFWTGFPSSKPTAFTSSPTLSWIERYLVAIAAFEKVILRQDANERSYRGMGEQDLTQAVLHFRQLDDIDSDEYRRSLWHLTTHWWHQRLWSKIVNALEALVENSLEEPVSDWSHERCIIRFVSALEKLDRQTEARRIMIRVKEAYNARDKTLRTLQNNSLFAEESAEYSYGVSLTSILSHYPSCKLECRG